MTVNSVIDLSSDSDNNFDAPIGQPQPKPKPSTKRPANSPASTAQPAKKARQSYTSWPPSELDRLLGLYDAQTKDNGAANYAEIAVHFPGRSKKDLHAAVYRGRKKREEVKTGGNGAGPEVAVAAEPSLNGTDADSSSVTSPDSDSDVDQPLKPESEAKANKASKPRASLSTAWLPDEVSRLLGMYDHHMATYNKPRYDLICLAFPARTRNALQAQVSQLKKHQAAAAGGAGAVAGGASVTGGVQAWLTRPAAPKLRKRLTPKDVKAIGKRCRTVLRILDAHTVLSAGGD